MFVKIGEAAEILGVSKPTIRKLAEEGMIDFLPIGSGEYRYDAEKYIKENLNKTYKENNKK